MTDAVVPFTGWGRAGWGELAFGEGSVAVGSATAAVGSVTVEGGTEIFPTGLAATASVGTVRVIEGTGVLAPVTGLQAQGFVGSVFVWGRIVPNQDPGYVQITPNQDPSWTRLVA